MKKVIVIGCSGAGKTTFSRKLRDATGLPLFYLDLIWHKADKTTATTQEFDEKLSHLLVKDEWILDGNYNRTLERRLEKCDTVFLFDFPLEDSLNGVKSRLGQKRESMPWIETELDEEFMQWIKDFPKNVLPRIYETLENHGAGKEIIIFKSRADVDKYLRDNFGEAAI